MQTILHKALFASLSVLFMLDERLVFVGVTKSIILVFRPESCQGA
jgi:hypothetical protein